MNTSVFQVCYVSSQNCFIYLPQVSFKHIIKSDNKIKVFSVRRFDSDEITPTAYFSGQLSNSLPDGCIGLNPVYARLLNIPEKLSVCVSEVTHFVSVAKASITPLTPDDYDILESCANHVEESLLTQLRIVWSTQVFPIWISKSLSMNLRVDFIEPNSDVGCLEQFSELVINYADDKHKHAPNNKSDIVTRNTESSSSPSNCPSDYFKEYFKEEAWPLLTNETISSSKAIKKNFYFRVHPSSALTFLYASPLLTHPFNCFVFRKHLPKLWVFRQRPWLCKITKVDLVLSDSPKSNPKTVVPENVPENEFIPVDDNESVFYVAINVIEDLDKSLTNYKHIPHHKCVYVSNEVMQMLQINVCDRLKVENCEINCSIQEPTVIFFSPLDFCVSEDEEIEFQKQLKIHLQNCLEESSPFLLNRTSLLSMPYRNNECKLKLIISSDKSKVFLLTRDSLRFLSFRLLRKYPYKSDWSPRQDTFKLNLDDLCTVHLEEMCSEGQKLIPLSLHLSEAPKFTIFKSCNFLVTGGPGSGKTTAAKLLFKDLIVAPYFVYHKYFSCKTLKGKTFDKVEKALKQCFVECVYHEPSILFLDDIDIICSAVYFNHDNYPEFVHSHKVAITFKELVSFAQSNFRIIVIATAGSSAKLNEEIMPVHGIPVFSVVFEIPELTKENRIQILKSFLPQKILEQGFNVDFESLASKTENYAIQDFSDLCQKIKFVAWKEGGFKKDHFVSDDHIQEAVKAIVPLSLRDVNLKREEKISWSDIGGMSRIKQILTEHLIWPVKYPQIFMQNPSKNLSGILLYGMPGTGKTMIASSLVTECRINFISIKGPELLSKFIGASEEGVRNIFKKAESAKPCILFFDEFDSLAPRRGQDNTGVTDRVVNQLLTQLDGVESLEGVTVVAATSRPDLIDPALLRPGRLYPLIHCPLPTEDERLQILQVLSAELPLASDIDLCAIAHSSENFTGADLRGLLFTAQMNAIDEITNSESRTENIHQNTSAATKAPMTISQKHLLAALESSAPSLSLKERQKFQNIYKAFASSKGGRDDDVADPSKLVQKLTLA
ncbi:unnamed protein product [Bemisia tabaci]|uniref:Peroxisomal ATPase PEX1 n=1 Tax=Bemisia tabaci TaxID=7038 RepID=A0A9P0A1T9_BEMTA|nr:unnamed protein product [Bemisia tabaci]